MTPACRARVERALGARIAAEAPVAGGCIGDTRILTTPAGDRAFLKLARAGHDPAMLHGEALGLEALRATGAVRVPAVLACEADFLLLEYVTPGVAREASHAALGRALAALHRVRGERFGFPEDNFLGSSPQPNRVTGEASTAWAVFYAEHRLGFQLARATRNGRVGASLRAGVERVIDRLPSLLHGTEEPPTLLHGDLWGGNVLVDSEGAAWLIDPAVYYGHREADLAMTTLFGGFPESFYAGYREVHPLAEGHEEREPFYQLYHLLNHVNLFGESYVPAVEAVIARYRE